MSRYPSRCCTYRRAFPQDYAGEIVYRVCTRGHVKCHRQVDFNMGSRRQGVNLSASVSYIQHLYKEQTAMY